MRSHLETGANISQNSEKREGASNRGPVSSALPAGPWRTSSGLDLTGMVPSDRLFTIWGFGFLGSKEDPDGSYAPPGPQGYTA